MINRYFVSLKYKEFGGEGYSHGIINTDIALEDERNNGAAEAVNTFCRDNGWQSATIIAFEPLPLNPENRPAQYYVSSIISDYDGCTSVDGGYVTHPYEISNQDDLNEIANNIARNSVIRADSVILLNLRRVN